MKTILIIGPGRLGGQIAFHALGTGTVARVFLVGRNIDKTKGIAADLKEAFPEREVIPLTRYEDLEPVDLTFFTFSSLEWSPSIGVNDRLIEAKNNLGVIDQVAAAIGKELLGTIIVISNPVDILTWHTTLSFRNDNVFGFGISLDEHRMAAAAERLLGIKCARLSCIGEHGSHIVPLLSRIVDESRLSSEIYDQIRSETFAHTLRIIRYASIPFYGPLRELQRVLDMLLLRQSGVVAMSKFLKEPILGIQGVALGVPISIEEGVPRTIAPIRATSLESTLFTEAAHAVASQKHSLF